MRARLGVNIDHVATIRQARGEFYPEVKRAAEIAVKSGADQITIHLREDRRHIQDRDVYEVKELLDGLKVPLNLEMGQAKDIIEIAKKLAPAWVCLVPENRQERTTEGGLNIVGKEQYSNLINTCEQIKANSKTKISLFIEADDLTIDKAVSIQSGLIDAVEIHTGDYAREFLNKRNTSAYLKQYQKIKPMIMDRKIGFHAGHGLTLESLAPLVELKLFEEYNIGHWIISEAVFQGMENVIRNMIALLENKQ